MRRPDGLILDVICPDEHEAYEGEYTVPLYAAPQPKAEQGPVQVPEGWKLVPVEPTKEMLDAVVTTVDVHLLGADAEMQYREDWAAMLAAAPEAPQPRRQPLTDEEIEKILGPFPARANEWDDNDFQRFARAVEAAIWSKT